MIVEILRRSNDRNIFIILPVSTSYIYAHKSFIAVGRSKHIPCTRYYLKKLLSRFITIETISKTSNITKVDYLLPSNTLDDTKISIGMITRVVSNHWTGLLGRNTGMDYWTDTFLVFKHIVVVVVSLIDSFWL